MRNLWWALTARFDLISAFEEERAGHTHRGKCSVTNYDAGMVTAAAAGARAPVVK